MASVGHIAIGMAAARVYTTRALPGRSWILAMILWSLLSLLPDVDVIGFSLGVRYEDEWGHRGATHSLAFSLALGTAIGAAAPLFRLPAVRTAIVASAVLTSHALLDTLTDGGLGCALLWPFRATRYFAPWNPIPVAPIGLDFFSPVGVMVATVELVLFAPLFWFALSSSLTAARSTPGRTSFGVWLVVAWLIGSGDPVRERTVGFVLREDTEFASRFSEGALRSIEPGQLATDVHQRLGPPLTEILFYGPAPQDGCFWLRLERNVVVSARHADGCRKIGIERATSRAVVDRVLGLPEQVCWVYSRSRGGNYYRARAVCFENERVVEVIRLWHKE
jgi:inner membrane protein